MSAKIPILRLPIADRPRVARALFDAGCKREWCETADQFAQSVSSASEAYNHLYVVGNHIHLRTGAGPSPLLVNSVEQMIRYLGRAK